MIIFHLYSVWHGFTELQGRRITGRITGTQNYRDGITGTQELQGNYRGNYRDGNYRDGPLNSN